VIRVYPIAGAARNICAGYGPRTTNGVTKLHDACDLCAPTGTPAVACDDGVVTYGSDQLGGNTAVLRTSDGFGYYYAHLEDVQTGSRALKVGQQFGRVDTTGNAALVGISHVHFQVWPGGVFGPTGTVHPDPTADLNAATVLTAPVGGIYSTGSKILIAALSAAALVALGYGAGYVWDNRGDLLR
jgi:murein DD-endopeptidase MepM/ murein hydrolase activator NlpD